MGVSLGLILDIILLAVLGATLFYVVRLYSSLNAFKTYRDEFQSVIKTLSVNIEQAYDAVTTLKEVSGAAAQDLDEAVGDAKYILDDLRQVNEASDNLAHRLEKLAQQGRQSFAPSSALEESLSQLAEDHNYGQDGESIAGDVTSSLSGNAASKSKMKVSSTQKNVPWQSTLAVKIKEDEVSKKNDRKSGAGKTPFAIRDPDYDDFDDGDVSSEGQSFASQAERELYEALHGTKG